MLKYDWSSHWFLETHVNSGKAAPQKVHIYKDLGEQF